MTRINLLNPSELTDQHLLAELREITRLPGNLDKALNKKSGAIKLEDIPKQYVMGTGHVTFFLNKFKWLETRFLSLIKEAELRGFNITYKDGSIFSNVPKIYYNDYTPSDTEIKISKQRILEKLKQKPGWYRYYGNKY